MRVANNVLLDCACSSGDNELHAKSSATCMLLTVSGRKCLPSAAMSVPKEQCGFLTLPRRAPPRLSDTRPTARVFYTAKLSSRTQVQCPLWVISGHFPVQSSCPLYPKKRTFFGSVEMSAKGQKRTFGHSMIDYARP
jgi:hypothetical protein